MQSLFEMFTDGGLFVRYLCYGFALKAKIFYFIADTSANGQSQLDKSWAGTLLCWFSTFASLAAAYFALKTAGGNDSKVTPIKE